MISKVMLRKWVFHLPPVAIRFARSSYRLFGRLLPSASTVLTEDTWPKACQTALKAIGGSMGAVQQGQCSIIWPARGRGTPFLKASLRVNPSSDLQVFCQVWTDQQYRAVTTYMRKWVSATDELRIIDAGANVGFTILYLKSQFPNAQIISLEPDESNYAQLTRNVAANCLAGVTPLQAGLWKDQAFLEVGRDLADQREWSFYVKEVAGPTALLGYDVQSLMRQANWNSIDLLKMDIEGAERYLFGDDQAAAKTLQNVRFLAIEIHDDYQIRPQIYEYLRQFGFEFFDSAELTIARNLTLTSPLHAST